MKKTSILLALIACLSVNEASAATITLDKATMLVPQGWSVADEKNTKQNPQFSVSAFQDLF